MTCYVCNVKRKTTFLGITCSGSCRGSSSGYPLRTSSDSSRLQSSSILLENDCLPAQERVFLLRAPSTTLSRLTGLTGRTVPLQLSSWKPYRRRQTRLTNSRTQVFDSLELESPQVSSVVGWSRSKIPLAPWGLCGVKTTVRGSESFRKTRPKWEFKTRASSGESWAGKESKQLSCTCTAIFPNCFFFANTAAAASMLLEIQYCPLHD